ncbi:MAG: DPP IV N-terminal domain-containing protein [Anaerolineae bacterium]
MAGEQEHVAGGHCPYLGLWTDRASSYADPSEDNYCYATGRPRTIELERQATYCLTAACTACPRYVPLPAAPAPRPIAPPVEAPIPVEDVPDVPAPRGGLAGYFERASKLELVGLTALVIAALAFIGVYVFVTRPRFPTVQSATPSALAATLGTATPRGVLPGGRAGGADTATPTPPVGTPTPDRALAQNVVFQATPTLVAGQQMAVLSPSGNSVGWVSSGDRVNHFGDRNLHAGTFDGQQYYSGLQFNLATIPQGSRIQSAQVELVGLSGENMASSGQWALRLLDATADANWPSMTFERLRDAPMTDTIGGYLEPKDLSPKGVNTFVFTDAQRQELERRLANRLVSFRMDGPSGTAKNLFSWDTGYGGGFGNRPVLRVIYQPPPTLTPIVITNTPAPANLATAAAMVVRATEQAKQFGTPTPFPTNVVTAPPPIVVVATETPRNPATAEWQRVEAQAIVLLYGTPTPYPTGVEVQTATPIPTPGPTDTPLPTEIPSPTITLTPLPLLIPVEKLGIPTTTATPYPTITPVVLPDVLKGKIAFVSDRMGKDAVFVVNPDGSGMSWLTNRWAYDKAQELERVSPDRARMLFVRAGHAQDIEKLPNGNKVSVEKPNVEVWVKEFSNGWEWNLTTGQRTTYDPVWSPDGTQVAFVSEQSGNDDIYLIDPHSKDEKRLTTSTWEWYKHPTYSADGKQIVFWSNRDGRKGLWIMNADGSDQRRLLDSAYNDWDPIWIK